MVFLFRSCVTGGCLLQFGTFKKLCAHAANVLENDTGNSAFYGLIRKTNLLLSIIAMSSVVLREWSAVRTRPGVRLHDAGSAPCRAGQGCVPVAVKQFRFYSHIVVVLADDLCRADPAQVCHQRGGDAL